MSTERKLVSQVHIPEFTGGGVEVRSGQRVKVIAVKGKQIGDLFAFVLDSPEEFISPGHTRGMLQSIYPVLGKPFYSNQRNPLVLLEEDTVGVHDLLSPACDYYSYKELGYEDHPSCRGNLVETLKRLDFTTENLPDPHNLFQNTPIFDLEGNREARESPAKPGDYVILEALKDLLVIVTACSMDHGPVNGGKPTDLMLEVYG